MKTGDACQTCATSGGCTVRLIVVFGAVTTFSPSVRDGEAKRYAGPLMIGVAGVPTCHFGSMAKMEGGMCSRIGKGARNHVSAYAIPTSTNTLSATMPPGNNGSTSGSGIGIEHFSPITPPPSKTGAYDTVAGKLLLYGCPTMFGAWKRQRYSYTSSKLPLTITSNSRPHIAFSGEFPVTVGGLSTVIFNPVGWNTPSSPLVT
jgi:hypothetical protein